MSDLVACPTCRSTLRLPAGASTVRCPKCKTTLQVIGDSPPSPPAAPKPLPFAPPVVKPKGTAKPAKATAKPVSRKHRPEVVDEVLEADQVAAEEAKAEAERKRKVKEELKEMDRKADAEDDRYDRIAEDCEWGRRALVAVKWSLLAYLFTMVFGYMVLVPLTGIGWLFNDQRFMESLGPTLGGFALAVSVGAQLGVVAAFALALRGPAPARHTAILGLVVSVSQLIFHTAAGVQAFAAVSAHAATTSSTGYGGMWVLQALLGVGSNLQLVGDALLRVGFRVANPEYTLPDIWWLSVAAGILEFTRLVLVCQLTQRYAELGKSDNLAAESPKTVSRIFFTLLVFALFRAAASIGFDWFSTETTMGFIAKMVHLKVFIVPFLIIGTRLLTQFRVTGDTEDVLIPDRVASKFDKFEDV